MKWLSTLLIVYVMGLSMVPCSDPIASAAGEVHTASSLDGHGQHAHEKPHDHTQDNCTPFCTCSCCGISLTIADFRMLRIGVPFESLSPEKILEKEYSLVSNYLGNIWQPPQA